MEGKMCRERSAAALVPYDEQPPPKTNYITWVGEDGREYWEAITPRGLLPQQKLRRLCSYEEYHSSSK